MRFHRDYLTNAFIGILLSGIIKFFYKYRWVLLALVVLLCVYPGYFFFYEGVKSILYAYYRIYKLIVFLFPGSPPFIGGTIVVIIFAILIASKEKSR